MTDRSARGGIGGEESWRCWERGLPLPEPQGPMKRKDDSHCHPPPTASSSTHHHPYSADDNREDPRVVKGELLFPKQQQRPTPLNKPAFVPALPPKTNVWGIPAPPPAASAHQQQQQQQQQQPALQTTNNENVSSSKQLSSQANAFVPKSHVHHSVAVASIAIARTAPPQSSASSIPPPSPQQQPTKRSPWKTIALPTPAQLPSGNDKDTAAMMMAATKTVPKPIILNDHQLNTSFTRSSRNSDGASAVQQQQRSLPRLANGNDAWGAVVSSPRGAPTTGSVSILTRRDLSSNSAPVTTTATTTTTNTMTTNPSPKAKKPKKGKPQLQNIVLGDLLPSPPVRPKTTKQQQQPPPAAVPTLTSRPKQHLANEVKEEFPALSSTVTAIAATRPPSSPPVQKVKAPSPQKPTTDTAAAAVVSSSKTKSSSSVKSKAGGSDSDKNKLQSTITTTTKQKLTLAAKTRPDRTIDDSDAAFSLMRQFAAVATTGRGGITVKTAAAIIVPGSSAGGGCVQRVKPRKKKFTVLKKKVLAERLRRWRELHPVPDKKTIDEPSTNPQQQQQNKAGMGTTVEIMHYLDTAAEEILEDEDEYQEVMENLGDLAEQCGIVRRIFVPKTSGPVFCQFVEPTAALGAVHIWNGLVVGGQTLQCRVLPPPVVASSTTDDDDDDDDDAAWYEYCLHPPVPANAVSSKKETTVIMLENALTEDDLEDDDCLEESLDDIRHLVAQHGTVMNVAMAAAGSTTLRVEFADTIKSAAETLAALSQLVLGGQALSARRVEINIDTVVEEECRLVVLLDNMLTDDDLEDEDALLESMEDIQELAAAHGVVKSVRREGDSTSKLVRLEYSTEKEANQAYNAFHGMIIGGETVTASRPAE
jgi:hypothetical protein